VTGIVRKPKDLARQHEGEERFEGRGIQGRRGGPIRGIRQSSAWDPGTTSVMRPLPDRVEGAVGSTMLSVGRIACLAAFSGAEF